MSEAWDHALLRWVAEVRGGITKGRDLSGKRTSTVPYLRVANVQDGHVDLSEIAEIEATDGEIHRYSLRPGDVLMNEGGDNDKLGRGAVWRGAVSPCLHQNHVFCVRPGRRLLPEWLDYVTSSSTAKYFFRAHANQSTNLASISSSNLKCLRVPLPPVPVQEAITDFLDRKTAAIDRLIEKKERLLALLAEKRAALIHRAVTKGLDANVPMKDSGVPWIGEIPAHWEVKRLKFVCRLESGHTPSRSEPSYWMPEECTIPWVSLNDTKTLKAHDYISDTAIKISPVGMANSSAHMIEAGAVVFTRDATVGLTAITTAPMAVSQHIIAWVCRPGMNNRYLLRVIGAMGQELDRLTFGATIKTIGMADVKELVTPLPPQEEQEPLVVALDARMGRLVAISNRVQQQIERLREYRQALITAAVTGQLDVTASDTDLTAVEPLLAADAEASP